MNSKISRLWLLLMFYCISGGSHTHTQSLDTPCIMLTVEGVVVLRPSDNQVINVDMISKEVKQKGCV